MNELEFAQNVLSASDWDGVRESVSKKKSLSLDPTDDFDWEIQAAAQQSAFQSSGLQTSSVRAETQAVQKENPRIPFSEVAQLPPLDMNVDQNKESRSHFKLGLQEFQNVSQKPVKVLDTPFGFKKLPVQAETFGAPHAAAGDFTDSFDLILGTDLPEIKSVSRESLQFVEPKRFKSRGDTVPTLEATTRGEQLQQAQSLKQFWDVNQSEELEEARHFDDHKHLSLLGDSHPNERALPQQLSAWAFKDLVSVSALPGMEPKEGNFEFVDAPNPEDNASKVLGLSGDTFMQTIQAVRAHPEKNMALFTKLHKKEVSDQLGEVQQEEGIQQKQPSKEFMPQEEPDAFSIPIHTSQDFRLLSHPVRDNVPPPPKEMSAFVVRNSSEHQELSAHSLLEMSRHVSRLVPEGGGEMRIRLKPEHLGELNVRVVTNGAQVNLQIRASDQRSKKLIEESMTSLKESLSVHQLNLSHVDLSIMPSVEPPARYDVANESLQNQLNQGFLQQENFPNPSQKQLRQEILDSNTRPLVASSFANGTDLPSLQSQRGRWGMMGRIDVRV